MKCALCSAPLPDSSRKYPGCVCRGCDPRAVNAAGQPPQHDRARDKGDNPVFIDGIKCWRKYIMGGYLSMAEMVWAETFREFVDRQWSPLAVVWCSELSQVYFDGGRLTSAGFGDLRNLAIETLHLQGSPVTAAQLSRMLYNDSEVEPTQVTDMGIRLLSQLPFLRSLHLWNVQLTATHLAQLSTLTPLRTLRLTDLAPGDEALAAIKAALPGLEIQR